jgi:hypothetical protein
MFKRTFWFTTGATAGFGGAMWLRRRVLQTVQRYTPEHVQADVSDSVRRWGTDVRAAFSEGRAAMADREAALRAELGAGGGGGDGPAAGNATGAAAGDQAGAVPERRRRSARAALGGRRRRRRSRPTRVG